MRLLYIIAFMLMLCGRLAAFEVVPIERIDGDRRMSISSNGNAVVGSDFGASSNEPILWTRDAGAVSLGQLAGYPTTGAVDVSADGTVVVGYGIPNPYEAFRWTQQGGMVGLGPVPGNASSLARAVSGDGSTIVGHDGDIEVGFIWTATGGMVPLAPPFGADRTDAIDVSADGSVVAVATEYLTPGGLLDKQRATIWTQQAGFEDLGPLPSGWNSTHPQILSADGNVLLGTGGPGLAGNPGGLPCLWSQDTGIVPLPMGSVNHLSMTPDASVVVANQWIGGERIPLIWDVQHGTRNLHDVLIADHGFSQSDLFFNYIRGISADQKTLVVLPYTVSSGYQTWALYLDKPLVTPVPEPASCVMALVGVIGIFALRPRR